MPLAKQELKEASKDTLNESSLDNMQHKTSVVAPEIAFPSTKKSS